MKLTLKIKLLPTTEQADLLLQTIREANVVCNRISETAWETKVFNQFRLHKEVYYPCKAAFNLRSQALVRCIAKVADASASALNKYREKRKRVLGSIQRKGTQGRTHACKRSCAKLLKRLKGKERTTGKIINHTIAKQIIHAAKTQRKGVAIENLRGIRAGSKERSKRNKTFRSKLGRWSFGQLRSFLEYKAGLNGVKLVVVEPAYTSKTCSVCHHIGSRANKSFKCTYCGNGMDADLNAAINIATLGAAVNQPEKSGMHCTLHAA